MQLEKIIVNKGSIAALQVTTFSDNTVFINLEEQQISGRLRHATGAFDLKEVIELRDFLNKTIEQMEDTL